MIKAIVFDLDGMLYVTDELWSVSFSRRQGITFEKISSFFENEFQECLRGERDLKEAMRPYLSLWGWKGTIEEILAYWFDYGNVDEDLVAMIKRLKSKGIFCALFTSNEKYRMEYLETKYGLRKLFDAIFTPYLLGATKKTDKRAVEAILDATHMAKDEIIFCDDRKENVDAFRRLGLKTIHYEGVDKFRRYIEFFLQL